MNVVSGNFWDGVVKRELGVECMLLSYLDLLELVVECMHVRYGCPCA